MHNINEPIGNLQCGASTISTGPYSSYPYQYNAYPAWTYYTAPVTDCCGDVHIFPCPHCRSCKCGKATLR